MAESEEPLQDKLQPEAGDSLPDPASELTEALQPAQSTDQGEPAGQASHQPDESPELQEHESEPAPQDDERESSPDVHDEEPPLYLQILRLPFVVVGWLGRYLLMGVCLTLLLLLAILYRPPEYLTDWGTRLVEKIILEHTGLPVQIGRIQTLQLWPAKQILALDNVLVYGHQGSGRPILVIPHARLESELLAFLLGQEQVSQLTLHSARIALERDRYGRINLQPQFKPSDDPDKPPGEPVNLPRVKLTLLNTLVRYRDHSPAYPLQEAVVIPLIQGDLHHQQLSVYLNLRHPLARLYAFSEVNIFTGLGWARLGLSSAGLEGANPYVHPVKDFKLLSGSLEAQLAASWEAWDRIPNARYQGDLELKQFRAQVPYYADAVQLDSQVHFDRHSIEIKKLLAQTGASSFSLQGQLHNYLQDLRTDLQLKLPQLEIGPILRAVRHPVADPLRRLQMNGVINSPGIEIQGTLPQLQAQGIINVPRFAMTDVRLQQAQARFTYQPDLASGFLSLAHGYWQDVGVHNLLSDFRYTPQALQIQQLTAQAFSGQLRSQAKIGLRQPQTLQANLSAQGVLLEQLQRELKLTIPADYRSAGRVNLQAQAQGALTNPRVRGTLASSEIRFPLSQKLLPVYDLQGHFDYTQALTTAALRVNSTDAGLVKAALSLRNLDQMAVQLEAQHLPLQSANKWSPEAYIQAGYANLKANLQGSLKNMQRNGLAFDAQASFKAHDLDLQYRQNPETLIQQHLDQAEFKLDWKRGLVSINDLLLVNQDSRLEGDGKLSVPQLLARKGQDPALQARLTGDLELSDFPILQTYDVQSGQVQLAASVNNLKNGQLQASLDSQGQRLQLRGVKLDAFELKTQFANQRLKIEEARLLQHEDQLSLQGEIDLNTPSPTLDLQASSERFKLETLVALLPPELKERFETQAKPSQELPQPDTLPNLFTLPQIGQRQTFRPVAEADPENLTPNQLTLSWRPIYEHWSRWKMEPNIEPAPEKTQETGNQLDTLRGNLSLQAALKGTVKQPDLKLQSLLQGFQFQESGLSETYLDARFQEQVLHIDKLYVLESHGGSLEVKGQIDLEKDLKLDISGRGIKLQNAEPFLRQQQMRLEGSLDFSAQATGAVKNPRVVAELNLGNLLLNKLFFDAVAADSQYRDGYLRESQVEVAYGNQKVLASGDVPVTDLNQPMALKLELKDESFGLINLFTQAIDWRGGQGALLVNVVGTPRQPQLEGSIEMQNTELYIAALRESVTDLEVKGLLTRGHTEKGALQQNIELESVTGRFGGGEITAQGILNLKAQNFLPTYLDLNTELKQVTVRYTQPGLFNTITPVEQAKIRLQGLPEQPVISGQINLGANGLTIFPFLRDKSDIPVSNSIDDASQNVSDAGPRVLFNRLQVRMPKPYKLNSPIFDIPILSPEGITLNHRVGLLTLNGNVNAEEGALYLLNNVLNIEQMNVAFRPPQTPTDPAMNPIFNVKANFNVAQVVEPVIVNIDGSLERLRENSMQFTFENTQGLTESELLGKLVGLDAAQSLGQGDFIGVASQFSDAVLRGLFDPLTSQISSLLGLEELSFGIAGQSISGPEFKFTIRSNPFFLVDDYIEEHLSQLSFLNKIRIRSTGYLGEQSTYELGTNYRFNPNWSLDYNFEQRGSIHNLRISGNYLLDFVLNWMDFVRTRYFGWEDEKEPTPEPAPSPSVLPEPETQVTSFGAGLW